MTESGSLTSWSAHPLSDAALIGFTTGCCGTTTMLEARTRRLGSASSPHVTVRHTTRSRVGGLPSPHSRPVELPFAHRCRSICYLPAHPPITGVMDLSKSETAWQCAIVFNTGIASRVLWPQGGPKHLTYQRPSGKHEQANRKNASGGPTSKLELEVLGNPRRVSPTVGGCSRLGLEA